MKHLLTLLLLTACGTASKGHSLKPSSPVPLPMVNASELVPVEPPKAVPEPSSEPLVSPVEVVVTPVIVPPEEPVVPEGPDLKAEYLKAQEANLEAFVTALKSLAYGDLLFSSPIYGPHTEGSLGLRYNFKNPFDDPDFGDGTHRAHYTSPLNVDACGTFPGTMYTEITEVYDGYQSRVITLEFRIFTYVEGMALKIGYVEVQWKGRDKVVNSYRMSVACPNPSDAVLPGSLVPDL